MARDAELMQDKPSNACCAALNKKHTRLLEKYSKLEELKNKFRDCTALVQEKYDVIEKENVTLKKALEEIKVQADVMKDEKEKEAGRRIDLEDEVSALQEEIQLLKQNNESASGGENEHLQERLIEAEKEIKQLKELLDQERGKAALAKKNAELEKKKADEALKQVDIGKNKASEAQKVANAERKKAEECRLLLEKLKKESDDMKSMLALEKSKSEVAEKKFEEEKQKGVTERKRADLAMAKSEEQRELAETNLKKATFEKDRADSLTRMVDEARNRAEAAENKVEAEKHKTFRERKRADLAVAKSEEQRELAETNLKKAMSEKDRADDLTRKFEEARNKAEGAENKVEAEKQKAVRERKRADLAVAESKEQRELAETNLKKAMVEKYRADDLNQKLVEARSKTEKLLEKMHKDKCPGKLVEAEANELNTDRNAELISGVHMGMSKNDPRVPQWMKKMLLEKEQNIVKEKKRADTEKKKAKQLLKVAEEHKKMAIEQKRRADQLSKELESCKLKFEELQEELQEFVSCRIYASNAPSRTGGVFSETDTIKILKKQLELERLFVKHAKKATKLEALRNKILHQELCHLKQDCLQFQQRLDILDTSFLLDCEGIDQSEKTGNKTSKEMLCLDRYHSQHISGTGSKMDPPYGGSERKMSQSSAINSSSTSFSDRHLVGSQERGTLSVLTSVNQGEDASNCMPTMASLSNKKIIRYNEHDVSKADKSMRSPIKVNASKRKVGYHEQKEVLNRVESVKNLHSKGPNLHQHVSEKMSVLNDILNRQKDGSNDESLKENFSGELSRPCKKREISSEGALVIHHLQRSGKPENILGSNIDLPNAYMPASSPGSNVTELCGCYKDGISTIPGCSHCTQDSVEMVSYDYMKLLDLDDDADENSYRRAIAMPLSPTLPEVAFHDVEELEVDNPEMLERSSQEGLSSVRDKPESVSSFRVNASEKKCNNLISNMLRVSDLSGSGNEESRISYENGTESFHGRLSKYLVISSDNRDNSSILRILQAIGSCKPQSSFINSAEMFLQSVLNSLLKAGDLSFKEKACVLFSLILHEISEVGSKSLTNILSGDSVQALGSMTMHITSAFSDPASRRIFMESCDLFELLAVIEDFLLQRKVLVSGEVSADFTSKLNLILNGSAVMMSEVGASAHLLIVGASLLASFCSAIDHVGFVCELSLDIIRMQKSDPAVMLAVLHSFAHICGSKYLTLEQYSLPMTAVKSLVVFLEKQPLFSSEGENPSKIWLCSNCPFSDGAISMENVALLLLENLQKQCCSESCSQDSLALVNLLVPRVWPHEEVTKEVSESVEDGPLSSTLDENLCNFVDILSLIEVLASSMSWNWTYDHLIGKICKYLESHLMECSCAAMVILLGQLGRLGVDASGYADSQVLKLRGWFSEFACNNTFMKLGLSVQFAMITSLFGLTPIKLEDIIEGKVGTPEVSSESFPVTSIKEWFFLLSHEQQSFLMLHQAASDTNSKLIPRSL